ncbi:MAG: sugar phosphate isomerase/epimerase, partial [Lachnospiraceae bacterium]|nr:sugar phosphate isomerase/epimerase [Lachnospiraceae bacterium]
TNAVYWCAPTRRLKQPMDNQEVKMTPEEISGYAAKARRKATEEQGNVTSHVISHGSKADAGWENAVDDGMEPAGPIKLSIFYEHLREAMEQTGKSLEELLAEAKKAGISGVEMEFSTLVKKPELHRIIQNAGMEISNLYQFFDFGNHYAAGMHAGRKMIDTAKAMGIQRVMIIPGFLAPEQAKELTKASGSFEETAAYMEGISEILAMRDAIAELTEYATERGIMVSMEDFDAFDSPIARMNPIKWFLTQVPGLKHTLDMGNYAFSNESAAEAYELFKDQIGHVHCKDRGEEKEEDPEIWKGLGVPFGEELAHRRGLKPVPVGDGYMPIAELVKKLKDQGYQGYMAIEHFGAPDQLGFMLKSAEYMRELLKDD